MASEKKQFLKDFPRIAEEIGVGFTVDRLLPALVDLHEKPEGIENDIYSLLFQGLDKVIGMLSQSELTVGYNGIRDHLLKIYYEFFTNDVPGQLSDELKAEQKDRVLAQLERLAKILTSDDK